MNFLYCAFKQPGGVDDDDEKKANLSLHSCCVLSRETASNAAKTRKARKNGKIDSRKIASNLKDILFFPLFTHLRKIHRWFKQFFASFRLRSVDCEARGAKKMCSWKMKSGDKLCSRSALFALSLSLFPRFSSFALTQLCSRSYTKNSRCWKICFLWTRQCSHTKTVPQQEEAISLWNERRESEMLVKHEFSAKTDARWSERERAKELYRMCTICGG